MILATHDLEKRFGSYQVLRGLDLSVPAGEVYGFLGRNGAGKTTAIRAVMGIIRSSGGELELFGERVTHPTREQKRRIGYVSQEQHFYPWMSAEALSRFVSGFYPTWDQGEFHRLLETLDIPPRQKVSQLSGGTRVKLALALSLAHRPELLILDEPTAGLDPAARREFLEMVSVQAGRHARTTFFSSHIVEEIERVATRVGILDAGRLRYEGDLESLVASVRRVSVPAVGEIPIILSPPEFEILSDTIRDDRRILILRAQPATWCEASVPFHDGEPLSVEDIFLALTVGRLFER